MKQPFSRDLEQLSAYLDGQLSQADSVRLESRIKADPELRSVYDGLRQSQVLLRRLPMRRAPRNFRLTHKMAGIKPPLPRVFPFFRLASVLASVLFFLGYAANLSAPMASMRTSAQLPYDASGAAPAMEVMVAEPTQAPEESSMKISATEAAPLADIDTTATLQATTNMAVVATDQAPAPDAYQSLYSTEAMPPQPQPMTLPVHPAWLFGLLGLAVVSGVSAFLVRVRTEQAWSKANAARPISLGMKDILLIALTAVIVFLLAAGLYWMATTPFYAPFP